MTKTITEQIVHTQNDLDVVFAEVVKLQKRLEIATKTLEDLELANDIRICMKAQEALEEMEGVK